MVLTHIIKMYFAKCFDNVDCCRRENTFKTISAKCRSRSLSFFKCKVKSIFKHLLMKENAVQLCYMAHTKACSFPQFSNKILVPPGLRNIMCKSHHIHSV